MASKERGYRIQINQKLSDGLLINIYGDDIKSVVDQWQELRNKMPINVISEDEEKTINEVVEEAGLETKPKNCTLCHSSLKFQPAGISRRTGKPYPAFYSCKNPNCDYTMNIM